MVTMTVTVPCVSSSCGSEVGLSAWAPWFCNIKEQLPRRHKSHHSMSIQCDTEQNRKTGMVLVIKRIKLKLQNLATLVQCTSNLAHRDECVGSDKNLIIQHWPFNAALPSNATATALVAPSDLIKQKLPSIKHAAAKKGQEELTAIYFIQLEVFIAEYPIMHPLSGNPPRSCHVLGDLV